MKIVLFSILTIFMLHSVVWAEMEPRKVAFKKTAQDTLYLFLFEPDSQAATKSAIVFFFGGGWVNGNPSQFFQHSRYLASRGMTAICAEYRIFSKHGTTPFECIEDGKSAVRWIRLHADDLGIDPNRIVAAGGSAGGHVAACTAVIDGFDSESEDQRISSEPNALVLFNPVIDTTERGYGAKKLNGRVTEISPVFHIKAGLPPTIIFHGTEDTTVPFENVARFCRLMKEKGNLCELVPFEGHKHAFFNYGKFDNKPYIETVEAMDRFLVKQGFLSGEPTINEENLEQHSAATEKATTNLHECDE